MAQDDNLILRAFDATPGVPVLPLEDLLPIAQSIETPETAPLREILHTISVRVRTASGICWTIPDPRDSPRERSVLEVAFDDCPQDPLNFVD